MTWLLPASHFHLLLLSLLSFCISDVLVLQGLWLLVPFVIRLRKGSLLISPTAKHTSS